MKNEKQKKEKSGGFSLLLGVLVGSLLISVGLGTFNLALKQASLSAGGRESQAAFYAADSGLECALYWDYENPNNFTVDTSGPTDPPRLDSVNCDDKASSVGVTAYDVVSNPNPDIPATVDVIVGGVPLSNGLVGGAVSTFTYNLFGSSEADGPQVDVTIYKVERQSGTLESYIYTNGYNTADVNSTRRVERGLYIHTSIN